MNRGVDAFKAALRRSIPLIVILVLLGVLAVNGFKQLRGPQYEATARVLISTTPLSSILTGTQPGFVDPQRVQDTALALASSPDVYRLAASRGAPGSAAALRSVTTASAETNSDVLAFTASSSNQNQAVAIANDVAAAYVVYRGQLTGATIITTRRQLQARLAALPANDPNRPSLARELNRLALLESVNSSDAVQIEHDSAATKTSPAPVKDSVLGLALGLVIALIAAALREAIDTTVRSESDVEEVLSVPVLASIRSLPRRTRLVSFGRHASAYADSYALLAAQLSQSKRGGEPLVLAVTSGLPTEGKTTTAANLAVALARRGSEVVLADLDFRRPSLGTLFQIPPNAPGALHIIEGKRHLNELLWTVALDGPRAEASQNGAVAAHTNGQYSGVLEVLPAGGAVNSQRAAQSAGLTALLAQLREGADYVVLDTPPALLTVEVAELAKQIDLVVVVVRQGRISQRTLRALRRQASTWPAQVAGAVLTDAKGEQAYSYYGSR